MIKGLKQTSYVNIHGDVIKIKDLKVVKKIKILKECPRCHNIDKKKDKK